ncbi:hypothetical protein FHG87_023741 [Trinorchestia longiramus]|nr:hypothetical protein FHG87_023741 [Trinorchestia longiramus]
MPLVPSMPLVRTLPVVPPKSAKMVCSSTRCPLGLYIRHTLTPAPLCIELHDHHHGADECCVVVVCDQDYSNLNHINHLNHLNKSGVVDEVVHPPPAGGSRRAEESRIVEHKEQSGSVHIVSSTATTLPPQLEGSQRQGRLQSFNDDLEHVLKANTSSGTTRGNTRSSQVNDVRDDVRDDGFIHHQVHGSEETKSQKGLEVIPVLDQSLVADGVQEFVFENKNSLTPSKLSVSRKNNSQDIFANLNFVKETFAEPSVPFKLEEPTREESSKGSVEHKKLTENDLGVSAEGSLHVKMVKEESKIKEPEEKLQKVEDKKKEKDVASESLVENSSDPPAPNVVEFSTPESSVPSTSNATSNTSEGMNRIEWNSTATFVTIQNMEATTEHVEPFEELFPTSMLENTTQPDLDATSSTQMTHGDDTTELIGVDLFDADTFIKMNKNTISNTEASVQENKEATASVMEVETTTEMIDFITSVSMSMSKSSMDDKGNASFMDAVGRQNASTVVVHGIIAVDDEESSHSPATDLSNVDATTDSTIEFTSVGSLEDANLKFEVDDSTTHSPHSGVFVGGHSQDGGGGVIPRVSDLVTESPTLEDGGGGSVVEDSAGVTELSNTHWQTDQDLNEEKEVRLEMSGHRLDVSHDHLGDEDRTHGDEDRTHGDEDRTHGDATQDVTGKEPIEIPHNTTQRRNLTEPPTDARLKGSLGVVEEEAAADARSAGAADARSAGAADARSADAADARSAGAADARSAGPVVIDLAHDNGRLPRRGEASYLCEH